MPTWSSNGGFVTITFKRPFFKANTIETNGEDNRTSKRDNLRSSSDQVQKIILSMDESYMTMSKIMEISGQRIFPVGMMVKSACSYHAY